MCAVLYHLKQILMSRVPEELELRRAAEQGSAPRGRQSAMRESDGSRM